LTATNVSLFCQLCPNNPTLPICQLAAGHRTIQFLFTLRRLASYVRARKKQKNLILYCVSGDGYTSISEWFQSVQPTNHGIKSCNLALVSRARAPGYLPRRCECTAKANAVTQHFQSQKLQRFGSKLAMLFLLSNVILVAIFIVWLVKEWTHQNYDGDDRDAILQI
jgi:hypothetical protein